MSGLEDISELDGIFHLPEAVTEDVNLRTQYEVIVARLREEAKHVRMGTVQLLLIERIASNYIALRAKETRAVGSVGGFAHTTAQKDFNTFWLAMTQQFQRTLDKTNTREREATLVEVATIIRGVLANQPADVRDQLLEAFADAFDKPNM